MRVSRSLALGAVLTFALALLSPALCAAQTPPTILTGIVRDQAQQPLADARITATGGSRTSVLTGRDGVFSLTVPPGAVSLSVTAAGYQTTLLDATAVADATTQLTIVLSPATLTTLVEIGRTSTAGNAPLNTSAAAFTQLSGADVLDQGLDVHRALNELTGTVSSAPSVWRGKGDNGGLLGQNGATPAAWSVAQVRGGLDYETASLIDGHPIATGRTGSFNNAFLSPYMLEGVEVSKGPGAIAPNINGAVGGAVNFRTLEPTLKNQGSIDVGTDGFGSFENIRFTGTAPAKRLSYAFDFATRSTSQGISTNATLLPGAVDYGSGVFINGAAATTPVLSATASPYYGLSIYGFGNVACCQRLQSSLASENELAKLRYAFSDKTSLTVSYLGSQASYNPEATAAFENPYLTFVPPPGYTSQSFAPVCCIRALNGNPVGTNVQSVYQAEFRTALGNDSLLARYYQSATTTFGANAAGPDGASTTTGSIWGGALLGSDTAPTLYNGTPASITAPGIYEGLLDADRLTGYSAEYDHPSGANMFSLAYDQTTSRTMSIENFAEPAATSNIVPAGSGQTLSSFLGRAQLQLSPRLAATLGVYYLRYTNHYTQDGGLTFADSTHAFTGPRFGLTWQPARTTTVRFAAGASVIPAYMYLLTNPGGAPVPNDQGIPTFYTQNVNSGDVAPETAFGYDLGADQRIGKFVVTGDLYETTLHGQFFQSEALAGTYASNAVNQNAGVPLPLYDVKTANLGTSRYEGVELGIHYDPEQGFGLRTSMSLTRAYVVSVPAGFYDTAAGPYTTNLGVVTGVNYTPNGSTYNALSPARVPYAQGYGELNYRTRTGFFERGELGITYYGNNNAYNEPPFFVLRALARLRLGKATSLDFAGDNLTSQYSSSYYTLYHGIPTPLANGMLGATDAGNYGPVSYRVVLRHTF